MDRKLRFYNMTFRLWLSGGRWCAKIIKEEMMMKTTLMEMTLKHYGANSLSFCPWFIFDIWHAGNFVSSYPLSHKLEKHTEKKNRNLWKEVYIPHSLAQWGEMAADERSWHQSDKHTVVFTQNEHHYATQHTSHDSTTFLNHIKFVSNLNHWADY